MYAPVTPIGSTLDSLRAALDGARAQMAEEAMHVSSAPVPAATPNRVNDDSPSPAEQRSARAWRNARTAR